MGPREHLLSDEKYESVPGCPSCGGEYDRFHFRAFHRRRRYWIITIFIHVSFLALSIPILNYFAQGSSSQKHPLERLPLKSDGTVDHDKHLVQSVEAPLGYHERRYFKIEHLQADAWNNRLFFGEPNYDSDWAWLNITTPRSFRLNKEEASRLNFTDSIHIEPGHDFSSMLGVKHNLHCLRRLRQMLYPDYYYPNESEEMKAHNFGHALHCLEALRTSVMCYPDLNPHPFFWSGMKYHDITVSAKVTRQCVDWDALQRILEPRDVGSDSQMRGTGPEN